MIWMLSLACLALPVASAQTQVIIEGQVKKQGEKQENLPGFKNPKATPPKRSPNPNNKLIEEVVFYYKIDEETRYIDLKNKYQNRNRGEIPLQKAALLAQEAFLKASVEKQLDKWLFHGGASPNVFMAKAHLFNKSKSALLNTRLDITLRVREGEWLVNPEIQMTDFAHLVSSAKWRTLWHHTEVVPVVAPGEDLRVPVLGYFNVLRYLRFNSNAWPVEMELVVRAPALGEQATQRLELVPDHFLVPLLY